MMKLAPIPQYFIHDAIEANMDASLLLEWVVSKSATKKVYQDHLKAFLSAFMSFYNSGDKNPFILPLSLSDSPSM